MNSTSLFKGVAIVIDDEVHEPTANIANIVEQISSANIPVLKYESIPPESEVQHFQNLSFVMLDWRLVQVDLSDARGGAGVHIPDTLLQHNIDENISFIKKMNELCFCPIFIFTNEADVDAISDKLVSENVILQNRPSNIFIKRKNEIH